MRFRDAILVDGLGRTVDSLSRPVDGLDQTVDSLTRTVDGFGRTVDGLSQTVDGFGRAVDGLSQKVDGFGRAVDRLSRTVDGLSPRGALRRPSIRHRGLPLPPSRTPVTRHFSLNTICPINPSGARSMM
jgi:hypothetical protein